MSYIIFDNESSEDFKLKLTDINYSVLPTTRDRDISIPNRRGRYSFDTDLDAKFIVVSFALVADDYRDVFTQVELIAGWLNPEKGIQDLGFSAKPDRLYRAKVSGSSNVDHVVRCGKFDVTFLIPDGVALGEDVQWNTGDAYSPENQGTVPTPVRVQLTSTEAATVPDIEIELNGAFVYIVTDIDPADVLVIENGLITLNDVNIMPDVLITSDLDEFIAPVGTFSVTANRSVDIQINWTERFV